MEKFVLKNLKSDRKAYYPTKSIILFIMSRFLNQVEK
jgi:hypothetical protein